MITPDRIVSFVLILIGAVFCISSIGLGIGWPNSPGSGFLPFIVGGMLILLSVGVIFEGMRAKGSESRAPLFRGKRSVVAMSVMVSLFAYSLLLDTLGFMLTTFLLLTFLFRVSEKQNMMKVVGAALLTTILAYFLFDYFLEVALPVGIFRYWGS